VLSIEGCKKNYQAISNFRIIDTLSLHIVLQHSQLLSFHEVFHIFEGFFLKKKAMCRTFNFSSEQIQSSWDSGLVCVNGKQEKEETVFLLR